MRIPKIYQCFDEGQIFSIQEAREKLLTSGNTLRKMLSELCRKGYLIPVRQGLYVLNKLIYKNTPSELKSYPLAIASKVSDISYLSYLSALQIHAGIPLKAGETLFITSQTKFNSFQFQEYNFRWCQTVEELGIESFSFQDNQISYEWRISDIEKSLLDCVRRPSYTEDFNKLILVCQKLPRPINFERLLAYMANINVSCSYNRMGFILEHLKDDWEIESSVFKSLQERIHPKSIPWNFARQGEEGLSHPKWKIRIETENPSL